jgi:hypothetical protein
MHSVCVVVSIHRVQGSTPTTETIPEKRINKETVNIMKTDHLKIGVEATPKS